MLGVQDPEFDGTMIKMKRGQIDGRRYSSPVHNLPTDVFGNYLPKPGDCVNVEYNDYGDVISITKAAN